MKQLAGYREVGSELESALSCTKAVPLKSMPVAFLHVQMIKFWKRTKGMVVSIDMPGMSFLSVLGKLEVFQSVFGDPLRVKF